MANIPKDSWNCICVASCSMVVVGAGQLCVFASCTTQECLGAANDDLQCHLRVAVVDRVGDDRSAKYKPKDVVFDRVFGAVVGYVGI